MRENELIAEPRSFSKDGPKKEDIFLYLLALSDAKDAGVTFKMRSKLELLIEWGKKWDFGWVNKLIEFYQGQISEQDVLNGLNNEDLARAYYFIGLKYEFDGDWEKAKTLYQKASESKATCIEVNLAKYRMGLYGFSPDEIIAIYESSSCKTTFKKDGTRKQYSVRNLFDGDRQTAWVPDNEDPIGEWISIRLEKTGSLSGITVNNGYNKSTELFYANSRVRVLRIEYPDGSNTKITLEDKMGPQKISLRKSKVDSIRFYIEDIYKGTKYPDLCISELKLTVK
jgi:tetratricopeptide (TPR) repeat protein